MGDALLAQGWLGLLPSLLVPFYSANHFLRIIPLSAASFAAA